MPAPVHDCRTDISRPVAAALTGAFLLLLAAVPVSQVVVEIGGGPGALAQLLTALPTRAHLARFEEALEKASVARQLIRPRLQVLLTRYGGFGNNKTIVGRDGWLFYAPGIAAVTGPGFLDQDVQNIRRRASLDSDGAPVHPDPRPAILAFHQALQTRGIRLVLLPIPDKATVEPNSLHGRQRPCGALGGNPAEPRLWAELRAAGIQVVDVMPADGCSGQGQRFLVQDTHWTPTWMTKVATDLGQTVAALLPTQTAVTWQSVSTEVSRVGDLVDMLALPKDQKLFAPETLRIRRVDDPEGQPFRPDPGADILLLGDSFTNIYSLPAMGWGEAAGLGPQLAVTLGRRLDVIAQNDAGAYASRQFLARELASGHDRLAGKRVVIWQFAARELAGGDWRPVTWPAASSGNAVAPPVTRFYQPPAGPPVTLTAEVVQASSVPRPGDVLYKDHIRALLLRLASGDSAGREVLAYAYSLRDHAPTPVAGLLPGARVTVRLGRWSVVATDLEGINRSELEDQSLLDAEPAWAELQ